MPTKRQRVTHQMRQRVTDHAVELWRAGLHMELHQELGLKPWHHFPAWLDNEPAGHDGEMVWALREELVRRSGVVTRWEDTDE